MKGVAYDPKGVAMLGKGSPLNVKECPFYKALSSTGLTDSEYINSVADMRGVKANRFNIEVSLAKCDVVPVRPVDDLQIRADDLSFQMYERELTQNVVGPDGTFYMNLQTSPAKFWKRLGCKTKEEALAHPLFHTMFKSVDHVPIFDYNGKVELLPKTDILENNKIRGTFNPPVDFIVKQKSMFDEQNDAIKKSNTNPDKWIKHGAVKQYGGFNELGVHAQIYDFHDEDDCNGYDRNIWLKTCYEFRARGFRQMPFYMVTFVYCMIFAIYSYVLCPDGVIRRRETGNSSGSNNTTTDNSLAHLPICIRLILKLWLKFKGYYPTLTELRKQSRYYIYSDDAFGSHNLQSFFKCTKEEFYLLKVETYKEFGLTLKPSQHFSSYAGPGGIIDPGHSFLGSSFFYDSVSNFYIPFPRVNKIASSMKYIVFAHTAEDTFFRAMALTILSAPVPKLYKECLLFLNFLANNYHDLLVDAVPEQFLRYAIDQNLNPRVWYNLLLGRELSGGGRF